MRRILGLAILIAAASCVRTIDPAGHTGKDGKYRGAQRLELEGPSTSLGGSSTGIVTYPGGDRVDWKKIVLPPDATGALELELRWKAPRPGLDLAFEVWDEWGEKLGSVAPKKAKARKSARKATARKSKTIEGVHGTIYVSVYASNRGDAGRYTLEATFKPQANPYDPELDELLQSLLEGGAIKIPDPPKLGAVFAPCGTAYDKTNPDCVENPPPCDRANKDPNNPSCKHLCDENKLDPKNPDCAQFYTCTTATWQDPKINPACANVSPPAPPPGPTPLYLGYTLPEEKDGKVWIAILLDKDSPVAQGWTGNVVDGNQKRLAKGVVKVIKVQKRMAYATVTGMSADDLRRYDGVVLDPPP